MSREEDLTGLGGWDGTSDLILMEGDCGFEIGRRGGGGGGGRGGGGGGRGGRGGWQRHGHHGHHGWGGRRWQRGFGPAFYDGYPYYDPFNAPVYFDDVDDALLDALIEDDDELDDDE